MDARAALYIPCARMHSTPALALARPLPAAFHAPTWARTSTLHAETTRALSIFHAHLMCNPRSIFKTSRCNSCNIRLKVDETKHTF
jgi:hypothetical protein